MFKRSSISQPLEALTAFRANALACFRDKLAVGAYQMESAACLCGETTGELIATTDRYALPVQTWLCRKCSMLWTSPRLSKESLELFYNDDYRAIYSGDNISSEEFFQDQIKGGKEALKFVQFHFPDGGTLFDIGCGAGGTLIPFQETAWRGFGCDTGGSYLDRGRAAGLVLEHGGIDSLRAHGKADLIMFRHTLEHLADPADAIQKAAELINENGCIYVELPGVRFIHRSYGGDLMQFLQNAHLHHFTLDTLSSFMSRFNFGLVDGNEYVRALYQFGRPSRPMTPDFKSMLNYLSWMEIGRQAGAWRASARLRSLLRSWRRA